MAVLIKETEDLVNQLVEGDRLVFMETNEMWCLPCKIYKSKIGELANEHIILKMTHDNNKRLYCVVHLTELPFEGDLVSCDEDPFVTRDRVTGKEKWNDERRFYTVNFKYASDTYRGAEEWIAENLCRPLVDKESKATERQPRFPLNKEWPSVNGNHSIIDDPRKALPRAPIKRPAQLKPKERLDGNQLDNTAQSSSAVVNGVKRLGPIQEPVEKKIRFMNTKKNMDGVKQNPSNLKDQIDQTNSLHVILPPEYDPYDTKWTLLHPAKKRGLVELMPQTDIYVSDAMLQNCLTKCRDYRSLAIKLLSLVFKRSALSACSSMTEKNGIDDIKLIKRPELDEHALTVLLDFVKEYARQRNWIINPQSLPNCLHSEIQRLRYKYGLLNATTPSGANKNARMSATPKSYAAAAKSDLIAAVTAINTGHLNREQAEEVEEVLNSKLWALVQAKANNPPNFRGKPTYINGSLQIWCVNKDAMEWLKSTIDGHTLTSGTRVEVRKQADLPKKVRCAILIPGKAEPSQIGEALRYFNPWAGVERWLLHTAQKQSTGTFIVVSIPEDLIPAILERGRQLSYLLGAVYIKFEERKGKFSDIPPQRNKKTGADTNQHEDTRTKKAETTPQPSTSTANNPPDNLSDTVRDLANVEMASVIDVADSDGEWTQGIQEFDLGTRDDSDDGVPFTK